LSQPPRKREETTVEVGWREETESGGGGGRRWRVAAVEGEVESSNGTRGRRGVGRTRKTKKIYF